MAKYGIFLIKKIYIGTTSTKDQRTNGVDLNRKCLLQLTVPHSRGQ